MTHSLSHKAALFVDFDNVYSGLLNIDTQLAERFATDPSSWIDAVAEGDGRGSARRFLIRNCYLNPSVYSKYKASWTRAGFRVIDCPSLTQRGKSSTDINLVLDAVDVLGSPVGIDEFFIASAHADFTSLVQRIRAADRHTTVIVAGGVASAYRSMADHVIELLSNGPAVATAPDSETARFGAAASPRSETAERAVLDFLARASGPVAVGSLAHRARIADPSLTRDWQQFGSFRLWLESMGDAVAMQLSPSPGWVWDPARFSIADLPQAPLADAEPQHVWSSLQEEVTRVTDVPKLTQTQFAMVFERLAIDLAAHSFVRNETTKRVRDSVGAAGEPASRSAINYIIQGLLYSHIDLNSSTTAEALATGWATNAEALCRGARMEFDPGELSELRRWTSGGLITSDSRAD